MRIYAVVGTSQQTIIADGVRYNPQAGEVLMQSERPDGDYIATAEGEWVVDKSAKLAALDAEYTREKATLCEQYTDAQIHGDTDTAEAIVSEMDDLDAWYDEEYEKIINDEGSEE